MPSFAYRTKSAELLVPGTNPEHTSIRTVLLPLPTRQRYVFGLAELKDRDPDRRERLLHILASHLEVLRADIENDGGNIPRRFEAMLVTMNADFFRLAQNHTTPIKNFHAIVGVMTNAQVFFSGIGNHHALFLHRTAERRYVVYELDAQLQADDISWEKPLITVLDGELHPGDVFYLASRLPAHALSLGDLQDILVTLPPSGALERIAQFVPAATQFGGMCFHVNDDDVTGPPKKANPMMSLSTFEETKSRTADLLGEQTPDISQKVTHVVTGVKKYLEHYSDSTLWRTCKRIGRAALTLVEKGIARIAASRSTAVRHQQGSMAVRGRFQGVTGRMGALHHAGITAVRGASRSTKIIGAAIVIIVIIVVVSIANRQAGQRNAEENAAYQLLITTIEEKRTAAEAAIIYGNTADAQILVTEATSLLATLPRNSSAQKTKADDLSRALTELLGKTRGLETVVPTTIAELPAQFAFPLLSIHTAGSAIMGVSSDGAPWRVNEVSKSLERVDVGTSPAQNITKTTAENEDILGTDMDKRLWRTSVAARTVTSLTSGTEGVASVDDIFSYGGNLYVLSAASTQIVKMRPQGVGFEAGTPWITARTSDLTTARAIAIDGTVWMLTATDILAFNSGRETPWEHADIDPAFVDARDIWTSVDSAYLYILDASDGRVVVMDKEKGGIVAQYIPNLSGVLGFVVREEENRILLTTSTAVYSYTASHLLK